MAKLYFYYSTMNAGKSTALLQASHNYEERGMRTLLYTARNSIPAWAAGFIRASASNAKQSISIRRWICMPTSRPNMREKSWPAYWLTKRSS